MNWFDEIDPAAAARGMSAGFTVLVIGGLAAPLAAATVPVVGSLSLIAAAVLGFAVAASRQGSARGSVQQGITASVGAYLLVVPLVGMGTHHWDPVQLAVTLGVAVVVGAGVGPLAARRTRARRAADVAARPAARSSQARRAQPAGSRKTPAAKSRPTTATGPTTGTGKTRPAQARPVKARGTVARSAR